ncbi:hypothetical protein KFL_000370010 [Klebsormidium nitens]|uniref:Uncharacterized protein n=1 Tax=Klebsormidium nitens TaxID=105231 RepID=A0A1Y1HT56_KLENI|nr:hypothetical protein KFL_000370010 [Klebsormidium nitens]|eukprot:GAQ79727.1 hypothetical protein KFL_000370010 [Klebsormidium nitens]
MADEQPTKVAKLAPEQSPAAASKAVDEAIEKVKNTDNSEADALPSTDAATASEPSLTEKKIDLEGAAKEAAEAEKPADAEKEEKTEEPASEKAEDVAANGKEGDEKEEEKGEEKAEDEPKEETVTDLGNGPLKFVVNTVKEAVGAEPVK